MKFILYLISSVGELFGVMVGISSENREMLPIGLAVLFSIVIVYGLISLVLWKLNKKGIRGLLLSFVILLVIIAIFCGICILIEYLTGTPIMK